VSNQTVPIKSYPREAIRSAQQFPSIILRTDNSNTKPNTIMPAIPETKRNQVPIFESKHHTRGNFVNLSIQPKVVDGVYNLC